MACFQSAYSSPSSSSKVLIYLFDSMHCLNFTLNCFFSVEDDLIKAVKASGRGGGDVSVDVDATGASAMNANVIKELWCAGRPKLSEEINNLTDFGSKAVVFVCGPQTIIDECAALTLVAGVDFKQEVFLF